VHKCKIERVHVDGNMKTVAVAINKGGAGKTMLAKTLATAAVAAGFNVLLLDMDTQQNSTKWGRRRVKQQEKALPVVRFTTEGDLAEELARAGAAGCDLAIIDTPPGRSVEAPAAVEAADLVLIPFIAEDVDSFEGVSPTARLARMAGKQAAGVLNCAFPGSRAQEDTARAVLSAIGLPMAPVVLHRYNAHRDGNPKGLTAQEFEPDSRAAEEVAALWGWVSAELQLTTSAPVHKKAAS
jgi:chromosome partitioning protein